MRSPLASLRTGLVFQHKYASVVGNVLNIACHFLDILVKIEFMSGPVHWTRSLMT